MPPCFVLSATSQLPPKEPVKSYPHITITITVAVVLGLLLLLIVVVLYRRRQLYGGFYIFTLPPMPDYIKKLDSSKTLVAQTHKLPYDPEWEFPRDHLQICKTLKYYFPHA